MMILKNKQKSLLRLLLTQFSSFKKGCYDLTLFPCNATGHSAQRVRAGEPF